MWQVLRGNFRTEPETPNLLSTSVDIRLNTSIGVARLVSPIFWYLSLSVSAFNPCQGRLPLKKYMNMCPNAWIRSSLVSFISTIYSHLKIIPPTLFFPKVSIYWHVSGGTSKALVLSVKLFKCYQNPHNTTVSNNSLIILEIRLAGLLLSTYVLPLSYKKTTNYNQILLILYNFLDL